MNSSAKKLVLAGALLGTSLLTRGAVGEAWEQGTGAQPPKNPAADDVSWGHALAWAAATGLTVALARTVVRRLLAEANDQQPLSE